ncbi:N-acetylmuramoyl-L-alanine amidase [Nocardioides sp. JQ2195]|uniref:N-acetylmuramoyl-L-alanine amidase family protein n=1 Tax=Nocardioides sp. JQ2195 TaxID=2592334 RepID=UPI00143ED825|nr:N-acetylmuramoyl-L-alanine amidase [Nocardioides sp. JQ2195]QIX25590.1 N-acetylmuramoyl-L-alanine amidase [Nocardioides sp. JQ2195]
MIRTVLASLAVAAAASVGALVPMPPGATPTAPEPATSMAPAGAREPLAGKVVVIDPGHQLGNHRFPDEINRLVPAGGFRKPCNTTGTSTNGGFPESTFTWQVAKVLQHRLRRMGATVIMTRHSNRLDRWGPCVDERGRRGNGRADLKVSIHGDGSYSGGHGFHVIAPADVRPTRDTHRASQRLARSLKRALEARGLPAADYVAGGDGLDLRHDLGTLNLSDMPTVMVELGNMRSPIDARRMTTSRGRSSYALGLSRGIRTFLR